MLCIKQHGSMAGAWRSVLDVDKSGSCWLHEFQEGCRNLGYMDEDEVAKLFTLLDVNETQQLNFEKINFLQGWEEEKKLDEFRQRLPTRWASKDPYMYMGDTTFKSRSPPSKNRASTYEAPSIGLSKEDEDELRRIYYMCDRGDWLGGSGDNTISLDELEKAVKMNKDVADFLNLHSRHAVDKFFKNLDSNQDGEVTWEEFKAYYIRENFKTSQSPNPNATPGSKMLRNPQSKAFSRLSTTSKLATGRLAFNDSDIGIHGQQDLGAPLEDWSAPATQDHKEQFLHFQRFLEQKFGTLARAFDTMDINGSGSMSIIEFQSAVESLRYILPSGQVCRAADTKRLFKIGCKDGRSITWKEFGITSQQWIEHRFNKRRKEMLRQRNRGTGQKQAEEDHVRRIRDPQSNAVLSFDSPLPRGWGFPPNFHPADSYFGRRGANSTR